VTSKYRDVKLFAKYCKAIAKPVRLFAKPEIGVLPAFAEAPLYDRATSVPKHYCGPA